jgi:glucose/arabinose dehydrogenase
MKFFLPFQFFLFSLTMLGVTAPQYSVINVPPPPTKYKNIQIDGLTFLPNGKLVVCLPSGEIFLRDLKLETWELFAEGLHNPLGVIALSNTELIVTQRPELTRIQDLNGDGKADDFEVVTDQFGMSGNYHEFNFTPVRDRMGNYFFALGTGSKGDGVRTITRGVFNPKGRPGRMHSSAPYRGCIMMHTPKGKTIPYSFGHRTPNGLGFDLEGNLFVTDNQGDWVGSSKLFHVQKDHFYGHAASLAWKTGFDGIPIKTDIEMLAKMRSRACVVFPHGTMANSPTEVLAISEKANFGPFAGQLLVGEMNKPRIVRVMLEEVDGELQGACIPFIDGHPLGRGCNRMAWAPDGSLFIGQTKHTWAGGEGIQQVVWNGKTPFEIQNMELTQHGFKFTFTKPIKRKIAEDRANWPFKRYFFEYREAYGSPRSDEVNIEIRNIVVSQNEKVVEIELAELKPWHIHEVKIENLKSQTGEELTNNYIAYTLNRLLEETPPDPLHIKKQEKN